MQKYRLLIATEAGEVIATWDNLVLDRDYGDVFDDPTPFPERTEIEDEVERWERNQK